MAIFQREGLQRDAVCAGRCEVGPHRWSEAGGGDGKEEGPEGPLAVTAWRREHGVAGQGGSGAESRAPPSRSEFKTSFSPEVVVRSAWRERGRRGCVRLARVSPKPAVLRAGCAH